VKRPAVSTEAAAGPEMPWRVVANVVLIRVRLTPKSSRDSVDGVETLSDGTKVLKARVRAVPEDGKANAALELLIAEWLEVAKRAATVVGGQTARLKTVAIAGNPAALLAALASKTAT
jgi:uncharacterized protein YggU (UPF0235/DUF167 family)